MRTPIAATLLALACAVPGAEPAGPAADPDGVRVRNVVLFSSGVGYFEHAGKVDGAASHELRFKTDQLNDILKSLLLEDLDGGRIGTVEYPSLDPLDKTLRSFQVDITGNPSLANLLGQLRGTAVTVLVNNEKLAGSVLGVEKRVVSIGDTGNRTVEVWLLSLLSGGTVRQVRIDEIRQLTLDDPVLQQELSKALAALSQARDQDKKPVVLHFDGQGARRVRLAYVVETPVWKTSYRLVMPPKAKAGAPPADAKAATQGSLQGWAIVENQTDNDWQDVKLSLVSGRPISFIQDLSSPLYVPRPVVEPELYASLRPQEYGGGQATQSMQLADAKEKRSQREERKSNMRASASAPGAPAADMQESLEQGGEESDGFAGGLDATRSIQSAAQSEKLGELFSYTVPTVSLPRQRSAMLPIVTDPVDVERVSIYNQAALAKHPLNGALVTNTTGKHLLQGPVTVLDGGYAGDARIDNLPPGDHRLLSYAIDIPVRADATSVSDERRIVSGRIVQGVLHLSVRLRYTQAYQFDNTAEDDRVIVVEHPFRHGWSLSDTAEPFEKTPQLYRWKVPAKAKAATTHTVHEELVTSEAIAIVDLDVPAIEFHLSDGAIPQPVKDALAKAAGYRRELADLQRAIDQRQQEITQIAQDQNRMRQNMGTVDKTTQYYQRLLAKLDEQETALEAKQKDLEQLKQRLEAKRQELHAFLANLSVK